MKNIPAANLTYITGYTTIAKSHKAPNHRSRGHAYNKVASGKLKVMKVDGTTFIHNNRPVNMDIAGLTRATKAAKVLHTSPTKIYDAVLTGRLAGFVLIDTLFVRKDDPALQALARPRAKKQSWEEQRQRRNAANRSTRGKQARQLAAKP